MLTFRECILTVCQVDGRPEVGMKNWEGGFESAPGDDRYFTILIMVLFHLRKHNVRAIKLCFKYGKVSVCQLYFSMAI